MKAETVSFLEAFAYGKSVIACHDPDYLVTKFGCAPHGEILEKDLMRNLSKKFDTQLAKLTSDKDARLNKGFAARREMIKNHTFESFQSHFTEIIKSENV